MKKVIIFLVLGLVYPMVGMADDIFNDYMLRISNYRTEIITKAGDVKLAVTESRKQDNLEKLEVQYRGRIPRNVQAETYRAKDNEGRVEKDFEALGKELQSFKTEVIKYYKGKVPKQLKKELYDLISFYYGKSSENSQFIIDSYQKK